MSRLSLILTNKTQKRKMHLMLISLVVPLILPSALTQQMIPTTVLQGEENSCPSEHAREEARENITNTVRNFIQNTPKPCGAWRKVVSLNMSDPSQECPSPWREYTSIRSCGRPVQHQDCESVIFSANNFTYNKVCGRAIGYQYGSPDAFGRFISLPTGTPDDNYVDGLSVTHGKNPRNHIWTFTAGITEPHQQLRRDYWRFTCPCGAPDNTYFGTTPPSYVGDNYFCESANSDPSWSYDDLKSDPLWDGAGCVNSQCCSFNTPPWFSVQLPTSTTDNIEARMCGDEGTSNEDIAFELLEIYIQ